MSQLDMWADWQNYVQVVLSNQKPHTRDAMDLRLGQKLFNVLYSFYRPDIANKIRGSIVDPFNNDNMIPAFLDKVDELWMD